MKFHAKILGSVLFLGSLFAFSPAFAGEEEGTNACSGSWDIAVGDDQLLAVIEGTTEAVGGSLARPEAEEFAIWGFCSLTDGNSEIVLHSDMPTVGGSIYLTFAGLMTDSTSITGTVKDLDGNELVFTATKRVDEQAP